MENNEIRATALGYLRKSLDESGATFREGQWEAIEATLARKRLLVVQRTGWGKSIVYFLATRLMRDRGAGPTLLVSPREEWESLNRKILDDEVDLLLISPERLANDQLLNQRSLNVDRLTRFLDLAQLPGRRILLPRLSLVDLPLAMVAPFVFHHNLLVREECTSDADSERGASQDLYALFT